MLYIEKLPPIVEIGFIGEKAFREINIDMTEWMKQMPDGVPSIVCIRPGETTDDAYIAATTFANNILTWAISDGDLGINEGTGMAQVWLEKEQNDSIIKRGKSTIFATNVRYSVNNPDAEAPEAQEAWIEQMTALKVATVNAEAAAETAQGKAEDAQAAAETAQGKAEDAQEAAETAQGKAEDAQEAAETAQGKAEDAQEAAETAQGKAEDAQDAAETAQGKAEDAQTAAESAQTAAETAQGKAEDAQEAAETAQGAAEDSAEDAEAWAVGERGGVPVGDTDPTYHNNSAYWAEQAEETLANKADKVSNATNGNFAELDSNGNLVDSGHKHSDYALKSGTVLNTTLSRGRDGVTGGGSLAFGNHVTASGDYSSALGTGTEAKKENQHVFGKYNVPETSSGSPRFVEIVGNGSSSSSKSNARALMWNGNEYLKGNLYVRSNDSSSSGSKVATVSEVDEKTDKVSGATNGNFAALDSSGNLIDSGHKHSDYLTAHQDITGKADKVTGGTADNFAALDSNGNLKDSGSKASDFLTAHQDISGKADKVTGATNGNIAGLDGNGNLTDSGKKASDFVEGDDFYATEMPMSSSDSTKVSEAVSGLKSQIDELCYYDIPSENGSFVQGTIDSNDGVIYETNPRADRIANKEFYKVADIANVSVSEGFELLYGAYSIADTAGFISVSSWASSFNTFTGNYVRFAVRRSNGNNISPDAVTGFAVAYKPVPVKNVVCEKASIIRDTVQNVAIASVPDAASNLPLTALRFAVEPIQAGSGDPYPGGGGKNLFEVTAETDTKNGTKFTINDDGSVTISGTPSSNTTYQLGVVTLPAGTYKVNGCAGGSTTTYRMACYNVTDSTTIASIYGGADTEFTLESEKQVRLYPVVITSFDGNPVTVYPMIRLASIADSTFAPYSNIRPITGRTSAVVAVTGKNLFCPSYADGVGKWANSSGVISDNQYGYISPYIKIGASGYIASAGAIFSQWAYLFYDANGNFLSRVLGSASTSGATLASGTIPSGAVWMRFQVYDTSGATTEKVTALKVQVEQGSTASSYTAYTGTTHTVQFGSTFYGGEVDLVNGQLVLTQALETKTGENVLSVGQSSAGVWYALLGGFTYATEATTSGNKNKQKSNMYVPSITADLDCSFRIFSTNSGTLYAYNNALDTKAKAQDFYNANPLQIWYPLAEPITVPLSDLDEIRTVEGGGTMNLWSDSGDIVEMTYPCDTKLYVDKKIAETVALILEN